MKVTRISYFPRSRGDLLTLDQETACVLLNVTHPSYNYVQLIARQSYRLRPSPLMNDLTPARYAFLKTMERLYCLSMLYRIIRSTFLRI